MKAEKARGFGELLLPWPEAPLPPGRARFYGGPRGAPMKSRLRARAGEAVLEWSLESTGAALLRLELEVNGVEVRRWQLNRWREQDAERLASEVIQQKTALGYARDPRDPTYAKALDGARVLREAGSAEHVVSPSRRDLSLDGTPLQHPSIPEVMMALLTTPQEPALEELVLLSRSGGSIDLEAYVHILSSAGTSQLRALTLRHEIWRDAEDDHSSSISYGGKLAPMLRAHPRLTRLELSAAYWRAMDPGTHETLERLSVTSGGVQATILRWLAESTLPALEELSLDFGAREGFDRDEEWSLDWLEGRANHSMTRCDLIIYAVRAAPPAAPRASGGGREEKRWSRAG